MRPSGGSFFTAIFASSINLESMSGRDVAISAANFLLQFVDLLRKELDRTAALGANHVVMTAAIVLMLVAGNAVVKGHLAGQAALRQQLQRSIHGGVADPRILFLHQTM